MKFANTTAQTPHQAAAREAAIVHNLDIVNNLARRLRRRVPPCVTLDDLTSAGTIGLIKAVDRFDGSRGLKFRSYAQHRVMGAMLDFLREEDPLSRDERRRVRESAANPPVTISLDQLPIAAMNRLVTTKADRTGWLSQLELKDARGCLSQREDRVIALLYDQHLQNRQVAVHLGVHESRVSQIKQHALAKLRAAMRVDAAGTA